MTFQLFLDSFSQERPPISWSTELTALWYDKQNNWEKAHELVDQLDNLEAAQIHAYLHRKEGDNWNANYWYGRAGKTFPKLSLDEEWQQLVRNNL